MKIGVFDSGVGGLTVLKSLHESGLFSEIIYFGDTARVPYGSKDKNTIIRYSLEAVEFFKNFDIDLLVVACNSVSATALPQMREEANFPVVGVVEAGVLAIEKQRVSKDEKILIIGTKATIESNIYQNELQNSGYKNLNGIETSLFVPFVENGILSGEPLHAILKHYFQNIENPEHIILGCTHFPIIGDEIANFFQKTPQLVHSGDAIMEYLKSEFQLKRNSKTELKFFASENPDNLKRFAKEIVKININ
ncbi:glutamate racemase [Thiovulum sp. ES]|nr:glutamate racemase [Thiovulum sp. ES]